jgi:7-cyano-7-deazaguanine reductase
MNLIEGKVLGKQISHPREYAPEILVAVPRHLNREQYQLQEDELPFVGVDAWHAYELGFLTEKGLPVTGVLKFVYTCNNKFLVESKSLKLYLNSFNMGKYGQSKEEGLAIVLSTIKKDLSALLQTDIEVCYHDRYHIGVFDFTDFVLLEDMPEAEDALFTRYNEDRDLLKGESTDQLCELKVSTHLLRSNCKITHQPDWGSAFIHIQSKYNIDKVSLLKYLVSIRDENHFHEEICEMLYKRLWDKFKPDRMMVACLYTRRGGLDICPVRANIYDMLPNNLVHSNILTTAAFRQ